MSQKFESLPGLNLPLRTIYCIGRNYAEHAKELQNPLPSEPVVFLKPASAACGSGAEVVLPSQSTRVDHEVELVVAIGREGKKIPAETAMAYVAGFAVGIDFTARDLQEAAKKKSLPWTVAKGFDTFAPISHFIPASDIAPHADFRIALEVNGERKQSVSTAEMLFSVPTLIAYLSSIFTLMPGDVIFTGTPAGVSPVHAGDRVHASLQAGEMHAALDVRIKSES